MKPILAIAALLCLTPLAFSQTDFAPRGYDTRSSLPNLTAEDTRATAGAGFAPVSRLMFRTARVSWEQAAPSSPTLGASIDFLTSLEVEFADVQLVQQQLDQFNGSIELMAQRLWSQDTGAGNDGPGLRLVIQNAAFALDAGQTPMADRSAAFQLTDSKTPSSQWRVVGYGGCGIRSLAATFALRSSYGFAPNFESYSDYDQDDLLFGPQLSLGAVVQRGRWLADFSVLAMAAYQRSTGAGTSGFREVEGSTVPYYSYFVDSTYASTRRTVWTVQDESTTFVGETRLVSSYYFSPQFTLDLMASAVLSPAQTLASDLFQYRVGIPGVTDPTDDFVLKGNVFLGLTYRQ